MSTSTATKSVTYRVDKIETAVQSTIRQVPDPRVRDAMWSAWTEAIEAAAADSPGRMPWEAKPGKVITITEQAAHVAMVRTLEAIDDISLRHWIRDVLALEAKKIETEDDGTGITKTCAWCRRPYRAQSPRSVYCSESHRRSACRKRKREAERDREQGDGKEQAGTA